MDKIKDYRERARVPKRVTSARIQAPLRNAWLLCYIAPGFPFLASDVPAL
jgi:hypothetical protein